MIADLDELLARRKQWRSEGRTVVWTNGCFDLLHVGHVRVLAAAQQQGDVLIVGINDDESVRHLKGAGRPLMPADERAEVVAALRSVDAVTIFSELIPVSTVALLQPDVYRACEVIFPRISRARGGGRAAIRRARVEFLPYVAHRSTTELVRRVLAEGEKGGRANA